MHHVIDPRRTSTAPHGVSGVRTMARSVHRWPLVLALLAILACRDRPVPTSGSADDHVVPSQAGVESSRSGFSISVDLPDDDVPSGSELRGSITVTNREDEPLQITFCGDEFAVFLANDDVPQRPIVPACAESGEIPVGTSTYPFRTRATYGSCGGTPPSAARCAPDGRPPDLPAGVYQLLVSSPSDRLQVPVVSVTIT
jgi:hypothetical protein